MIKKDWQRELLAHNTFGALYCAARSHVGVAANNFFAVAIFAIAIAPMMAGFLGVWKPIDISTIAGGVRALSALGVAFSTSILGFLVSGFALFFAITRSDVLIILAAIPHKNTEISRLQFILYSFMYVFLHYIVFMLIVTSISVAFSPGSILNPTARYWNSVCPLTFRTFAALAFAGLAAWLGFAIALLKSFIWNLYQTVLVAITVGADMDSGRLKPLLDEVLHRHRTSDAEEIQ